MYKKAWCTCKVVVLLIKPIVFVTFSLPSASLDLKVPIVFKKVMGEGWGIFERQDFFFVIKFLV